MSDVHVSKESEIIKYRKTKKRMNQEKLLDKLEKKHRLESEVSPSSALEGVVNSGREYTVSVAISGSILDNAQSPELRSYLGGQIGRALAVFNIDEVIVFEDRPRKEEEKASKEEEEEVFGDPESYGYATSSTC
ncbi:Uncharacterized protein C9orf114 [Caligus rogercresseyi]|uniref:Uncharacterized protein C9orf114 n=1 Tax=Caligus rogercresseyi TaxID=217165 RepID=A0A7T8H1A7_CALRO|nr:Uncharacterized protein C9orf114 [Caligus rogercresseyi]